QHLRPPVLPYTTLFRSGYMRHDGNGGNTPVYEPNSFDDAPKETPEIKTTPFEVTGFADSVAYDSDDHYSQPRALFQDVMNDEERDRKSTRLKSSHVSIS